MPPAKTHRNPDRPCLDILGALRPSHLDRLSVNCRGRNTPYR
ncbi:MAG: hypothetical protein ACFB9N_18485 [Geitlerinemataceae cyanobacterium]